MASDIIPVTCASCGAAIRIDASGARAVCQYCGSEHIVESRRRPALRPQVAQPAGVSIHSDPQAARLVQRWFSFKFIPLAFFAFAWDAFLIFWYGMAFAAGAPWIMIVFPVAHVAVGAGITYYTLAGFINRTVVEVTRDTVSVRFEPLPWIGNKTLRTADLRQLFCKEKTVRTKNGYQTQYLLYAVTTSNTELKLLGGLDNPDTAVFLEQQLERWLKIGDQPVASELPR